MLKINVMINYNKDEIVYRALRGCATEEEEQAIAGWYSESPEACQREFDNIHAIIDATELGTIGMARKERGIFRKAARLASFAAASAIIAFVTGYTVRNSVYDSLSSQMTSIEAPFGEHFIITLPDSSSVHLNSGARIEYPVVFRKDRREVFLNGEAMFEVVHDEKKPFIVNTFASEISVLGTKFDVKADKEENMLTTTLLEGSVKVVNLSVPGDRGIIMEPNDRLLIKDGIAHLEKLSDPEDHLCWTAGLIRIGEKSFEKLMGDFEKAFGVKIHIRKTALPDISDVSGKIRINDGIENALRILQKTADFRFTVDSSANIIIY